MDVEGGQQGAGEHRIAIIGSGFAGLGMAIELKRAGIEDFAVFEADAGLGGTWRANTYPGCACDVPSHLYSYSFERNPDWSHNYSPQAEILAYLERCADKYDVRRHIRFETPIVKAEWDAGRALWRLESAAGERFRAQVLVAGTGPLRNPRVPDIPGLDAFDGAVFHSARWDHDYDLRGKRVAVVGTGASAIQLIPEVAPEVASMHVFQRTAPWIVPKVDGAFSEEWKARFRAHPTLTLGLRNLIYWIAEALGTGFFVEGGRELGLNGWRERVAKAHMEKHIHDPALRAALTPDYAIGCKRVLFSNDYYPALARDNVHVVPSGVARVEGRAVIGHDGSANEVDAILLGTGFEVSELLAPLSVVGEGGVELSEAWREGVEAYYGVNVSGFPNLHILVGPNTGLGHNSIVFMIEAQTHYVMEHLARMEREQLASLDVKPRAQREFNRKIQERLADTVWAKGGCRSWYLDERGKNVTLWPGYTFEYWLRTRRVRWDHFEVVTRDALERPRARAAAGLEVRA